MKKRGFGVGRYNGVGGKVADDESIEDATKREAEEEIGIKAKKITKVAELAFTFPHNSAWDQIVHTYICSDWKGEPTESEEMSPEWFPISNIPFYKMWPDDVHWLPKVIEGQLIKGGFTFGEGDVILEQQVEVVEKL